MSKKMSGAKSLVQSLESAGVDVMFGIPGGAILPAYDPIFDSSIRHILVRHEQGAGHAATGYAQVTGRVGVCIATSGPGATNLVTPLADAAMDSVPMVAITGQVPSAAIGTDAFQEADIRGITMPFTKHNYLITDPNEIGQLLRRSILLHLVAQVRCLLTLQKMRCRRKQILCGQRSYHSLATILRLNLKIKQSKMQQR